MPEVYISLSELVISNGPYEHTLSTGDKLYDVGFQFRVTVQQTNITQSDLDRVKSFVNRGNVSMSNLEEICKLGRRKPEIVIPCHKLYYRDPLSSPPRSNNSNPNSINNSSSNNTDVIVLDDNSSSSTKYGEPLGDEINKIRNSLETKSDHHSIGSGNSNGNDNDSENDDFDYESIEEDARDLERFCTEFGTADELEKMRVEDVLADARREINNLDRGKLFSIQKPKNFAEYNLSEQLRCSLDNIKDIQNHERKFISTTDAATSTARVPQNMLFMVSQDVLSAANDFVSKIDCPQGFVPSLVVVPVSVVREDDAEAKPKVERKAPHQMTRSEVKVLEEYYAADKSEDKREWITGAMKGGLRGIQARELGRHIAGAKRLDVEKKKTFGSDVAVTRNKKENNRKRSVIKKVHRNFLAGVSKSRGKMSVGEMRQLLEKKYPELKGDGGEHLVSLQLLYCVLKNL